MPIFVMYGECKGNASTLTSVENARKLRPKGLIEGKLLGKIFAKSWDEACQKYYDYNDWGTYVPPDFSECEMNAE